MRMRVTGTAGEVERDFHVTPTQGLSILEAVGGLEQLGQVVDTGGRRVIEQPRGDPCARKRLPGWCTEPQARW